MASPLLTDTEPQSRILTDTSAAVQCCPFPAAKNFVPRPTLAERALSGAVRSKMKEIPKNTELTRTQRNSKHFAGTIGPREHPQTPDGLISSSTCNRAWGELACTAGSQRRCQGSEPGSQEAEPRSPAEQPGTRRFQGKDAPPSFSPLRLDLCAFLSSPVALRT